MIDKKLIQQAEKMWIDVNVDILSKKWLPDDVINDILEIEIDKKLWKGEFYTFDQAKEMFDKKFNSNVVECIN